MVMYSCSERVKFTLLILLEFFSHLNHQAIVLLKEFEKKEREMKARAATNLSFLYFLEGDIPNAEKHAELAVTTDRYNAKALVNQGNCFYARVYFLKFRWAEGFWSFSCCHEYCEISC
jgi:hypothetical protein